MWARLLPESFIKPINYPELKRWEKPTLWNKLKSDQVTKEILVNNIQEELLRQELCGETDGYKSIQAQLWYSICELGWFFRDNGKTRDIDIWARKMVRTAGEDIVSWLGATWRILDNFTENEIVPSMLEETLELVATLQKDEPDITAGTIFRKLYEQIDAKNARDYQDYIDAIFAGWDEFRKPTFVTQQIQNVFNAREKFCPKCCRKYEFKSDVCKECGCKLEIGNRYVCFSCQKYIGDEFAYCPYCGTKTDRYPNIRKDMDTIELALQKFTFGADHEPSDTAAIYINGESFRDIIWREESKIAAEQGKTASGYAWLDVGELLDELTEEQDISSEDYLEPKVLGCSCGYSDCEPLHVKITETEDTVTWSGFYNPFHSDPEMTDKPWDYSKIREFHFDKKQYYDEIAKLKKWYEETDN